MQGGDGGVHGAGKLGLSLGLGLGKLGMIENITAEVDGMLIDTRDSPGSLILEIWDNGYQQVDILVPFFKMVKIKVKIGLRREIFPVWTSWGKRMGWLLCFAIKMEQKGC